MSKETGWWITQNPGLSEAAHHTADAGQVLNNIGYKALVSPRHSNRDIKENVAQAGTFIRD
jgi:hypothetical protein